MARKRKKTVKEQNFLKNLFKTGNKRKAAKKAYNIGSQGGSKTKKQADNTADRIAQKVTKRLQSDIDAYYKKQDINIDWVLKRLVNKADFSPKEIIQLKALELIGKHKKMFVDRLEIAPDLDNEKLEALAEKIIEKRIDGIKQRTQNSSKARNKK
jgi:hypothetical protein